MDSEKFKELLGRMTQVFQGGYNPQEGDLLKQELNQLDKNYIIDSWVELLKAQGPIERTSENTFEIYDVSNFMDEDNVTSEDYIHIVELKDSDNSSAIFMKFYLIFYCLLNGLKSTDYNINYGK